MYLQLHWSDFNSSWSFSTKKVEIIEVKLRSAKMQIAVGNDDKQRCFQELEHNVRAKRRLNGTIDAGSGQTMHIGKKWTKLRNQARVPEKMIQGIK